jgi:hypothetical protein
MAVSWGDVVKVGYPRQNRAGSGVGLRSSVMSLAGAVDFTRQEMTLRLAKAGHSAEIAAGKRRWYSDTHACGAVVRWSILPFR